MSKTPDPWMQGLQGGPGGAEEAGGLELGRWIGALRRRRKVMLVVFVLALVPASFAPFVPPDVFDAASHITVLDNPEVLDFGSDFMPRQLEVSRRDSPLEPVMAIVASDVVLGSVVDQLPESEGGTPRLRTRLLRLVGLARDRTQNVPPELRRRARIDELRDEMELTDAAGNTILSIRFQQPDAARAAFLANAVADSYVNFERERRQSASRVAINWLTQKSNELRDRIRRREEAAATLVKEAGIKIDPNAESGAFLQNNQMLMDLQSARAELLFLEQQIAELAPQAREASAVVPDQGSGLRERYRAARTQLEALRLQYTPNHPEVERLEAVVEQLRVEADAEPLHSPTNPQALSEHSRLQSERSRLRARVSVLTRTLDGQKKDAGPNAEAVAEYRRLERELGIDRELLQVLLQRTNETALEAAGATDPASVLEYAIAAIAPVGPNRPMILLGGLAGALGLALALGILLELLDSGLYTAVEVAHALGTSFLGSIPVVGESEAERRGLALYSSSAGESFRNVRTSLMFAAGGARLRSLLVTSGTAGEGRTTVSVNLAGAFAGVGRRVLLIDADMRRPRIDNVLELKRSPGLSELLDGSVRFEQVVHSAGENLDVVTSGVVPPNPAELLSSPSFDLFFSRAKKAYDLVLIDAPILLAVSDALLLSSRVDGVLLVHKPGAVDRKALRQMAEDLRRMDARLLGLLFNQVDASDPDQYPSYMRSPYIAGARPRAGGFWPFRRNRGPGGSKGG